MRKMTIFLVVVSFLSCGFSAEGIGPKRGYAGRGFPFIDRFVLKDIGVDDNTIKEIIDITIEIRTKVLELQGQIRKAQLELQLELEKLNYNDKKIKDLIRKIVDLRAKQQYILESRKFRILKRLTPEQRKKLFKLIERRREAFWGRMMRYMDTNGGR